MLEIRDLSVHYGMHRALSGASLEVGKGEIVVILGANGAGKSTLLRAVAGLSEGHVSGQVAFNGRRLSGLGPDAIVEAGVALVPEGRGIFGDLTVRENLLLGAYSKRARAHEAENLARVHMLFPKLAEREGQVARTMSGGEQQMVAIGRAIMSAPEILLLDEPSLGLSPLLCRELFQSLAQIRDSGLGVLLVEQNARQSLAIADRGYLLENGEIVGGGAARDMLDDPAVQKAYLGGGGQAAPAAGGPARRDASGAGPKFITPGSARPGGRADTSALAGENIEALVARAAGVGKGAASPPPAPAPKPAPVQPAAARPASPPPRPAAPPPPRAAAQPVAPRPAPPPSAPSPAAPRSHEEALQRMLAEMEEAARRARLPSAGGHPDRNPEDR